uniref:Putative conserved oligomeric Golgi complex subunit 4 n=1 Tax=Davidia involucrata TaxID=16924 RepID=A0A5B7BSM2_DAVIN
MKLKMHQPPFLRSCKTAITVLRSTFPPKVPELALYSSITQQEQQQKKHRRQQDQEPRLSKSPIGSPARIEKLIASQKDPLLAKEIFDLASRQPNFRHSYSSFHTLILKLGRSGHFSLMEHLLSLLKSDRSYRVTPSLFSHIIRIYGDARLPDKALNTFYTLVAQDQDLDTLPNSKHLNCVLQVLVAHPNYLRPAFDLFKSAHHRYGISPNTKSYNILMLAFCLNGDLSIAYSLFNQMFKRDDVVPDVESYRILMQGLCRKSQVNKAVDLLEDMLNKGFVPDSLSYTTLLNSLCRKKKLKEAYKLLCRMTVKGCNPDIVHYNTVILGFCRERRALDACKVLEDMPSNGCLPNLVSYRTLVGGLCDQGMYHEAKNYMEEMLSKGFSPHFSVFHALIKGFCNVGKIEEAGGVLGEMLRHGEAPHVDTWVEIIPRICHVDDMVRIGDKLEQVLKVEIKPDTRIVEAGVGLEEYLIRKTRARSRKT